MSQIFATDSIKLRSRRKTYLLWNFLRTATISISGASLDIRRGTFRLWVVASVLFVIGVGAASYSGIRQEFENANTDWEAEFKKYGGYSFLPADCSKAPGIAGADYDNTRNDSLCWYRTEDFRVAGYLVAHYRFPAALPEHKDVSNGALSESFIRKALRESTAATLTYPPVDYGHENRRHRFWRTVRLLAVLGVRRVLRLNYAENVTPYATVVCPALCQPLR